MANIVRIGGSAGDGLYDEVKQATVTSANAFRFSINAGEKGFLAMGISSVALGSTPIVTGTVTCEQVLNPTRYGDETLVVAVFDGGDSGGTITWSGTSTANGSVAAKFVQKK